MLKVGLLKLVYSVDISFIGIRTLFDQITRGYGVYSVDGNCSRWVRRASCGSLLGFRV